MYENVPFEVSLPGALDVTALVKSDFTVHKPSPRQKQVVEYY